MSDLQIFVVALFALAVIALLLWTIGLIKWPRWDNALLAGPLPLPYRRRNAPGPGRWHALGGERMELEATGFAIERNTRPNLPLYCLYSPEGWLLVAGGDLQVLKGCGERLADERAEFQPASQPAAAEAQRAIGAARK
jgi:hypothetical protein